MGWTVYILRCGDGSLYTGCTNDLSRRLAAHRKGKGAKYTRSRLPVALAYRSIPVKLDPGMPEAVPLNEQP